MEKIECGMYVRTKYGIGKIINKVNDINDYYYGCWVADNDIGSYDNTPFSQFEYLTDNEVLKASYNIIDLIEVGDYVNECKVTRILGTLYDKNDLHCYCDETWNKDKKCLLMIPANEIKSIVTKEQFEAMKYEIK